MAIDCSNLSDNELAENIAATRRRLANLRSIKYTTEAKEDLAVMDAELRRRNPEMTDEEIETFIALYTPEKP